mgnify:CR=1 FL=1
MMIWTSSAIFIQLLMTFQLLIKKRPSHLNQNVGINMICLVLILTSHITKLNPYKV